LSGIRKLAKDRNFKIKRLSHNNKKRNLRFFALREILGSIKDVNAEAVLVTFELYGTDEQKNCL
jgi:hypothetical protein